MKEYEFSIFDYDWKWDDTKKALRVTERKQTPEEWVDKMLHTLALDPAAGVGSVGRYTYAYDDAGRVARACCAASDKFDAGAGAAIAYARLRNLPIHPVFQPACTTGRELIPLQDGSEVRPGSRVYSPVMEEWGTVTQLSRASQCLVTVRWDNRARVRLVRKTELKLAVKRRG